MPGLRQLRRVLLLESGPLASVLVIFLIVLFVASAALHVLWLVEAPMTVGAESLMSACA